MPLSEETEFGDYSVDAATPALIAIEEASCAVVSRFLQNNEPPMTF